MFLARGKLVFFIEIIDHALCFVVDCEAMRMKSMALCQYVAVMDYFNVGLGVVH